MTNRHPRYGERPEDMTDDECTGITLPNLLTLIILLLSVLWAGTMIYVSLVPLVPLYPTILLVVFPLLLFGFTLYTLKVTNGWTDWTEIRPFDKTIAAMTLTAGLAMIATTCYVCYLFYTWAQGMSE